MNPWITAGLTASLWLSSALAWATQDMDFYLNYAPTPGSPGDQFDNATRSEELCDNEPGFCAARGWVSKKIFTPITAPAGLRARGGDPRDGAYFAINTAWRSLSLVLTGGVFSTPARIRITGVGGTYLLDRPATALVPGASDDQQAHSLLWSEGHWGAPTSQCPAARQLTISPESFGFFWDLTSGQTTCSRQPTVDIPWIRYNNLFFTFEMEVNDPNRLINGTYSGRQPVPITDIDLGNAFAPQDLDLAMTLTVAHDLRVVFDPGSDRLALLPSGGWEAWRRRGQNAEALSGDLPFSMTSSGLFYSRVSCDKREGMDCALEGLNSGERLAVKVAMSLGAPFEDSAGQPVTRLALHPDAPPMLLGTASFTSGPGQLHFDVDAAQMAQMLDNPGERYEGVVTLTWDADP